MILALASAEPSVLTVTLPTQALQASPNCASIYEARSLAALKAEDYMQSLNDAAKAIQLDPTMAKAYLRQG